MGTFDPPVGRKSSVVILDRRVDEYSRIYRIVTSISTRSSTEVLEVGSEDGCLSFPTDHAFTDEVRQYTTIEDFIDSCSLRNFAELVSRLDIHPLFRLQASALEAQNRLGFEEVIRGAALLGFTATKNAAGVLLATRLTTKATLPGGHKVFLVSEARWEIMPLHPTSDPSPYESDFWRCIQQHSISGTHFFCETADLTRPFPSRYHVSDPDLEFVWNSWLARPFKSLGLHTHCPSLLQGAVESADEVHPTGQRYTQALVSRRSRRHPGTRYIARGLNELAGPGNEIEAELIMWAPSAGAAAGAKSVQWARVFWRRGTVPIWWGVELQPLNKGLQAEMYVRDAGPYVGMLSYIRGLRRRAADDESPCSNSNIIKHGQDRNATSSEGGKVIFVNLLHSNSKKAAEVMLSAHFGEGMRRVGKKLCTGNVEVSSAELPLLNFDWHGRMAEKSEEKGIEDFWNFIKEPVMQSGIALGTMVPGEILVDVKNGKEMGEEDVTPWGRSWHMQWLQRQNGLLRFNCADSLDRTNAATCFAMLPVLQEGLRLLGIPLDTAFAPAAAPVQRLPLNPTLETKGNGLPSEGQEENSRQITVMAHNKTPYHTP